MKGKQSAVMVVLLILVLLIAGGLLWYQSIQRERKAEEERRAAEEARIAELERQKVPEVPSLPPPEEVVPPEEPEPTEEPEPIEPAVVIPAPPPVSTAECTADSPALARQKSAAAPENMVYVPGGVFTMGSPPKMGHTDEDPAHSVCLSGFYIDRHEVTNAQFKKFVEATGYVTDAEGNVASEDARTWRNPYGAESSAETMPNHPVVCVTWNDANAYARWIGKRLPTEAEWEKAARGTDGRIYPWGNANPTGASANIADKSAALKWSDVSIDDRQKIAAPVGSFPGGKSGYGVEDMAGNVWEWCYDWWAKDYYEVSPPQNPVGPETGEHKVIRGGSWFYTADGVRTAQRMHFRPTGNSAAIGFRCVKQ